MNDKIKQEILAELEIIYDESAEPKTKKKLIKLYTEIQNYESTE